MKNNTKNISICESTSKEEYKNYIKSAIEYINKNNIKNVSIEIFIGQ